jgi:NAD(P)-dependent dehydrogenase (short-subunit alcohol dehydrogenase family)
MKYFGDRVAIITGGASGIGRALAKALVAKGAKVVLADINAAGLEETLDSLTEGPGTAIAIPTDVTDPDAVQSLVDTTVERYGKLDLIFNNAGIGVFGEAKDVTIEDWYRVFDVNIRGVLHGVLAAYPIMIEQGHGHIVNTASLAGLTATPLAAGYTATKHAVVGLSTTLRLEAREYGVRVSAVCPGLIDTAIVRDSKSVKYDLDKIINFFRRHHIRPISPDRCAREILRGVRANRRLIVVTQFAKWSYRLERFFPWLSVLIGRSAMKKLKREQEQALLDGEREKKGLEP